MIPTVSKKKLPASLAYPIGAELLTRVLSTVPQIDELKLRFTLNQYDKSAVTGQYLVFTARYLKWNMGLSASRSLDESGFYGPKWEAYVYAVPKRASSLVRLALIDHGFELIRKWYTSPRNELWMSTSHELNLHYSSVDACLTAIATDK